MPRDGTTVTADVAVIGGGVTGAAIAYGLLRRGRRVVVLDEGDKAFRASRGNGGLVWVQNKGLGCPSYTRLSLRSSLLWTRFARDLQQDSGIDVAYERRGGLQCCLSEAEADTRAAQVRQMTAACSADGLDIRMIAPDEIRSMEPQIGPDVVAASYSPHDGAADPIRLLRALHAAILGRGGRILSGPAVEAIEPAGDGSHMLRRRDMRVAAGQVVIAAGNGARALGGTLGVALPVRPQKGQAIITERFGGHQKVFIIKARQTIDGHFILGSSIEEDAADLGTDLGYVGPSVARTLRILPFLQNARVLRTWAAYRVMTPDSFPIYGPIATAPGIHVATCHSGITLAAFHALDLPGILTGDAPADPIAQFLTTRFEEAA
ncbi:NAD(P)/FAD-dependent oxidoreductase [Limimaricola pyoseonensis]|uniref:Glycine/D-amino acid oxidase n=1 Tax=Limimaricola pyoseonensis TaxID=521013 RepID=A0A1G7HU85_9RHOB|nr:FAD-dependent oxidoreductase [Limimaricola pyoseonensis]SDF03863.1 Glycine/D-amino acid oxidase [Limimaricola pyoseonensis]